MHESGHEQDARWRKAQRQEVQSGEETGGEPKEVGAFAETAGGEVRGGAEKRRRSSDSGVDKDSVTRQLEESEGYQKIIECVSQGSECELERKVQNCLAYIQEVSRLDKEQLRAVEARSRGRGTEREQTAKMEQSKKVRFVEEEERPAQSADEKDVMSSFVEVRTGRGRAVRGRDKRGQANETSGKGKGKAKGDNLGKGFQQSVKMLKED